MTRVPRSLLALVLATAVGLTAGGCSAGDEAVSTGDAAPTSDAPTTTAPERNAPDGDKPTGPGEVLVTIEMHGGYAPVGYDFAALPAATIYTDGTSLTPGAALAIYPGPALTPVVAGRLDAAALDGIVTAAREAGLDADDVDFGSPPLADASTTTLTLSIDGQRYTHEIYALGSEGGRGPVGPDVGGIDGLSAAQLDARDRAQGFIDVVTRLATGSEGDVWTPDRYRILTLDPALADAGILGGDEVESETRPWPLEGVELEPGGCAGAEGEDADELAAAMDDANELTRWETATGVHALVVRAVLPHEPTCPAD